VSSRACLACATTCARLWLRAAQLQDPGPRGPDQWTRLKLEYERKCYQNAEKIVRERLRLLQAATRCEAEPRSTITAQQNADRACGSRIRQVIFLPYWINIVHRR